MGEARTQANGRDGGKEPKNTAFIRKRLAEDNALVAELERLHRRPKLLASFIRHAEVPIRLRL